MTSIARKYGVTKSQILSENSIADANLLRVGQVLSITLPDDTPAPTPVPTSTPAPTSVPDTGSPAPASAPSESANPPAAPAAEEQPTKAATAVPATPTATPRPAAVGCNRYNQAGDYRYTIRSGDSLYGLANRYNVTVGAIKSRNCMTSDVLVVGQSIIIPMGAPPADATPAPTSPPRSGSDRPATPTPTPWPTATPRPVPTATPVPAPTADNRSWLDKLLNR